MKIFSAPAKFLNRVSAEIGFQSTLIAYGPSRCAHRNLERVYLRHPRQGIKHCQSSVGPLMMEKSLKNLGTPRAFHLLSPNAGVAHGGPIAPRALICPLPQKFPFKYSPSPDRCLNRRIDIPGQMRISAIGVLYCPCRLQQGTSHGAEQSTVQFPTGWNCRADLHHGIRHERLVTGE